MSDDRSRREKLEAMANQSASPAEAEIARKFLEALDAQPNGKAILASLTEEQFLALEREIEERLAAIRKIVREAEETRLEARRYARDRGTDEKAEREWAKELDRAERLQARLGTILTSE